VLHDGPTDEGAIALRSRRQQPHRPAPSAVHVDNGRDPSSM
jgi:hypothetical protein